MSACTAELSRAWCGYELWRPFLSDIVLSRTYRRQILCLPLAFMSVTFGKSAISSYSLFCPRSGCLLDTRQSSMIVGHDQHLQFILSLSYSVQLLFLNTTSHTGIVHRCVPWIPAASTWNSGLVAHNTSSTSAGRSSCTTHCSLARHTGRSRWVEATLSYLAESLVLNLLFFGDTSLLHTG